MGSALGAALRQMLDERCETPVSGGRLKPPNTGGLKPVGRVIGSSKFALWVNKDSERNGQLREVLGEMGESERKM